MTATLYRCAGCGEGVTFSRDGDCEACRSHDEFVAKYVSPVDNTPVCVFHGSPLSWSGNCAECVEDNYRDLSGAAS